MPSYALMVLLGLVSAVLASAFRVLREYERGVVFMLGRFWKVKGPGLVLVIPVIQQMVRTDLRTIVMDVPSQDVISRDNVSVKVNAVVYFRVVDPEKSIIQVENFDAATSQLAQTTLRSDLGSTSWMICWRGAKNSTRISSVFSTSKPMRGASRSPTWRPSMSISMRA